MQHTTQNLKLLTALAAVLAVYFALAKLGLELASVNPSATPVWPPTGFAIGMALLFGYRIAPAIFLGAFLANITTAGNLATSVAIAAGNAMECLIAANLINRWSGGVNTFDNPSALAKFVIVSFLVAALSASVGVTSLSVAGFARWSEFAPIWFTWWAGDVAGALIFTPLIVLWGIARRERGAQSPFVEVVGVLALTVSVSLVAFSPLVPELKYRGTAGFLAIAPLMWAAVRLGQRETATVIAILASVAVWGQQVGDGPFNQTDPNESLLLLLAFMASVCVPSLALSAAVQTRRSAELKLRESEWRLREANDQLSLLLAELSHRVNNILAVVQSIVSKTMQDDLPREQLSSKLMGRLLALARSHNALTASSWKGATLHEIIGAEVEPYLRQIDCKGPSLKLSPAATQSFALAIHELITNSAKYGALSVPQGHVSIDWSVYRGRDESEQFRFSWTERDGPTVSPPTRVGFGTTLLKRTLGFDNEPLVNFDPLGFRFEFEVPLEQVAAPELRR